MAFEKVMLFFIGNWKQQIRMVGLGKVLATTHSLTANGG